MDPLFWIILSTFIISLISLVGCLVLVIKEDSMNKILLILVALSAGGLMGGAFFHLLPEAISEVGSSPSATLSLFTFLLLGFCIFLILEQFIEWYHEHYSIHKKKPVSYLVLFSDLVHNFIDGLVVSGSFMIGIDLGLATTLAIILHEIPQELGDFAILIYGGFKNKSALLWNYISGVASIIGGVIGYYLSTMVSDVAILLLSFAAGSFIYIAASDLIPEIKHSIGVGRSLVHFITFLIGILLMFLIKG
ncbi:ZIP family metal transporter [Candidatus Bathyarchaeota archaeon]|nr:ZIP family metal transporter [Candidatus Bathyarchaeota archaeon]